MIEIKENIPISKYVTFGIGGNVRYLIEPRDIRELKSALDLIESEGLNFFVLGAGSNTLFPDNFFDGVVIRMAHFNQINVKNEYVETGAGVPLKRLIYTSKDAGLSGLEPLMGIPGEVGGSIAMNAGTKEREIGDLLESVTIVTFDGSVEEISAHELGLTYRNSRVRDIGIIVKAKFKLIPGDPAQIEKEMERHLNYRKETQPFGVKSAGCIFKNPSPETPAGYLLEKVGLKGYRIGDAMYSTIHANFIINLGNAKEKDVLDLIEEGKKRVRENFGIELEEEIIIVRKWISQASL